LQENYNDEFQSVHEVIINRLNTANDKGIVFLHGLPGTGKTSYIRYLTSLINKKMIYIPPEFAHKIASPDFLPLLIDNPNSVLIIEDAENVIEERENTRNVSVSNLLNIADGLLSDCLSIQILCTFNTHISKIDKALLRKGRLIASYEFKPLSIEKAQRLSEKLGFTHRITHPMTLSDIYNQLEKEFSLQDKPKIGF
jgi:ATP-dependent 26S proteasome regulatory subunit